MGYVFIGQNKESIRVQYSGFKRKRNVEISFRVVV